MKLTSEQFRSLDRKAVTLIGMSGIGKTTLARKLPSTSWFHFSADYRIGTRYLLEPILDNIKEKAMQTDFLRDLLRSDSIFIGSAMTFDNLELLSKFIGKLGNESKGGLPLKEFHRRQQLHHEAEVSTMLDVGDYIRKAYTIYGYEHFLNDSSGSICELDNQGVLNHLSEHTLILFIGASEQNESEVISRQVSSPKPLYYDSAFLDSRLDEYLEQHGLNDSDHIDPDQFVRWIFPRLIDYRRPKYEEIAAKYGYTIDAASVEKVRDENDFVELVCTVLDD